MVNFEKQAKEIVLKLLNERNVSYVDLSLKLSEMGIKDSNANLSNKINKGKFSFAFFLTILSAINCDFQDLNKNNLLKK